MPEMPADEPELPGEVAEQLNANGITAHDEVTLRCVLEQHIPGYSLYRLMPAAIKRWKCRYRVILDTGYYDGQSVREAYARALLQALETSERS